MRQSLLAVVALLLLHCLVPLARVQGAAPATVPSTTGKILCAYWREIPGTRVEDLTSLAAYPGHPNEQVLLDRFATPEDQEGNFGTVVRGYIHPPQDGAYIFYISGNSQCELWLSSDNNPEGKRLIASVPQWSMPREWTASPEQQSPPVLLKQGGVYYIEARHKNGGGDNHLAVAWKLPDGTLQSPIPGEFLSPAPPVVVPPPAVSLPAMPSAAGRYRIQVQVEYLTQRFSVPVLLTLPPGYSATGVHPAIVFLPDTDQEPDADDFYVQGPDKLPPADPLLQFICISPQPPAGRNYTQRTTIKAMAAVVAELCKRYPVDRQRIGLTGDTSGGTAVWRLAMEMPGFYSALAPVNGRDVRDAELPDLLRGCTIRIYTDIAEGFATGCANRMSEALATLQPKPQVVYLGEKELGKAPAASYCYALPAFYAQLMVAPNPPMPAQPTQRITKGYTVAIVGLVVAAAVGIYLRFRRQVGA